MADEYPLEIGPNSSKGGTPFDVLFGVIAIVASIFSAYTTYDGFSYDMPWYLAFSLSILIGLGLIAVNFMLKKHRQKALPVGRIMIFFAIIFVFSFVSNTNAIYTHFLRGGIIGDTQEKAWTIFQSEASKIRQLLLDAPEVSNYLQKMKELEAVRLNLRNQIVDLRNPGMGALAQSHLRDIGKLLGTPPTPLRAPPGTATEPELSRYAKQLDALIADQVSTQFSSDPGNLMYAKSEQIKRYLDIYSKEIKSANFKSETTDAMKLDLGKIEADAENLLKQDITVQTIDNVSDSIGSFQYTWRNFVNWISPAAIILSVLLGALLDWIAPAIALLLYRPEDEYR